MKPDDHYPGPPETDKDKMDEQERNPVLRVCNDCGEEYESKISVLCPDCRKLYRRERELAKKGLLGKHARGRWNPILKKWT